MKKNALAVLIISITLIVILTFAINEYNKKMNTYHTLAQLTFEVEVTLYITNLGILSATLEAYNEDFNATEQQLYQKALNNIHLNLNYLRLTLHYLSSGLYGSHNSIGKETHQVNSTLNQINRITQKEKKQEIITVLNDYTLEFEERKHELFTTEQGVYDIKQLLEQMNKELAKIINE